MPQCKWILNAAFYEHKPKLVQQIISTNKILYIIKYATFFKMKVLTVMLILLVHEQMLQVELCTPCNDNSSTLYAEINNVQLPNSACEVVPQKDKISNYYVQVTFTIVSEAVNTYMCTLSNSFFLPLQH